MRRLAATCSAGALNLALALALLLPPLWAVFRRRGRFHSNDAI